MAVILQDNWRFCQKCYSLWWFGRPDNGVCPAGAGLRRSLVMSVYAWLHLRMVPRVAGDGRGRGRGGAARRRG
jgi:hypothetical protein